MSKRDDDGEDDDKGKATSHSNNRLCSRPAISLDASKNASLLSDVLLFRLGTAPLAQLPPLGGEKRAGAQIR